jgi:hypothetical protein
LCEVAICSRLENRFTPHSYYDPLNVVFDVFIKSAMGRPRNPLGGGKAGEKREESGATALKDDMAKG